MNKEKKATVYHEAGHLFKFLFLLTKFTKNMIYYKKIAKISDAIMKK